MKNLCFTVATFFGMLSSILAQDFNLVNGFNNDEVSWDNISNTWMLSLPDQGIPSGRMKQLNDSTYVYFFNRTNNLGTIVNSRVVVKTLLSNGGVNTEFIYAQDLSISGSATYENIVTDVVVHNSNIYIIKNEPNGPFNGLAVTKLISTSGTWGLDFTFGTNGKWTSDDINAHFTFALGTIESNTLVVYGQTGWPLQNIGRAAILSNGQGHAYSFITQNSGQHFSFVGDLLTIGNDTYIADNGYDVNGNGDYTPVTRIAKISSGTLATSFGSNGYLWMNWSNQTAGLNSSIIQKIIPTSDNQLLVVGNRHEFNTSANIWFPKGRVSKITTSGTFDNAFGTSGTFSMDNLFGRFDFNSAYEKNGAYFVAGYSGPASFSPSKGLILQLNPNGTLNTSIGDAGIARLNPDNVSSILSMYENADGNWVLNVLNGSSERQIGIGAYTFEPSISSVNEADLQPIYLFPNPTTTNLNIQLNRASTVFIFNVLGEMVMQMEEAINFTIDVSGLKNGVYFVKAGNTIQRFVKH